MQTHTANDLNAAPVSSGASPGALGRFRAYLAERFPVPVTLLLALATAAGAVATAQADLVRSGAPVVFDGALWGGVALIFLYLLHLRVFDEHKDFAIDAKTRPDRPVQRGLVSLGELKVVGAIAVAAQLAIAFAAGVEPGLWYLAALVYSVLMFFEFFAREWLSARIHWYAVSHTLSMSLLTVAVAMRLPVEGRGWTPELFAFAGLNLVAYVGVDVLRKTWAPESEVEGLDSWSSRLGLRGAAFVGTGVLLVSAALGGFIGWGLGGGLPWIGVVAAVTAWGIAKVFGFAKSPTPKGEGTLQAVAGLHILVLFVGVAVVAAITSGAVISVAGYSVTAGV